jgi:hypothetical protein
MTVLHSTPGRITAAAVGIPLLLAGIGEGAFSVTSALSRTSEKHAASYAWHGGSLKISNDNGDLTVRRSTSATTVSVSYTEHYGLKKPKVTGALTAAGVELSAKCPTTFYDSYCSVNYTVLVPSGVPLVLNTGDGAISLDGLDAAITVHSGDGSLHGTDLRSSEVNADSGDGAVSLQWATAPEHVKVSAGDGSVHLMLPEGSGPYAITKSLGDGQSDIAVAEDPKASRTLVLHLGDGSLHVQ